MSEKPKRPWFRFHLLSAVLMMLAAGTFLRLNQSVKEKVATDAWGDSGFEYIGWPCPLYRRRIRFAKDDSVSAMTSYYPTDDRFLNGTFSTPKMNWYLCLGVDLCVGFVMLILLGFLCESLLRRREARKP